MAIIGLVLGGFSLWFAQYVDFEHDLKNLRRESTDVSQKKKGLQRLSQELIIVPHLLLRPSWVLPQNN